MYAHGFDKITAGAKKPEASPWRFRFPALFSDTRGCNFIQQKMPDHAVHDIVQLHTAHGIKPAPGGLHEAIVVEWVLVYTHRHTSMSPGHQPLAVCHSDSHCIMVACGHTHVQLIATPTPGGVTQRLALHGCVSIRIHVLTFTRSILLSRHQPLAVCHAELHGTVAGGVQAFTSHSRR